MFREMRRKRQQLAEAECIKILMKNTSGVLAVLGDSGYPYAVPLSYVYDSGSLYFHCAKSGHKLDAIKNCDKVSFCVTDQEDEICSAIEKLAVKYNPADSKENRDSVIEKEYKAMCMVKIQIEHMTGKESVELVNAR